MKDPVPAKPNIPGARMKRAPAVRGISSLPLRAGFIVTLFVLLMCQQHVYADGFTFPSVGDIGNAAANLDQQRLEAQRRAAAQAAEIDRQRIEAQRRAAAQAAEFDRQRLEAQRRAAELDRQRLEAQRRLHAQYQDAQRRIREMTTFSSNKGQVQASLRENGWQVAFGKEIDFKEYYIFAHAVAASVVSGNPGPVMAYIEYMVTATKAEVMRNLQAEGGRSAAQLEMQLIEALDRAIKTGRMSEFTFQGLDVKAGIATYQNQKKVSGNYPKIDRGSISWDYLEKTFPLPNTHQPYVSYRLRYRIAGGDQGGNTDLARGMNRINQGIDAYNQARNLGRDGRVYENTEARIRQEAEARIRQEAESRIDGNARRVENIINEGSQGQTARNLGITYDPVPYPNGTFGARLNALPTRNSAAAQLGLEPGDIVFALDGQRFMSPADVMNHMQRTSIDFVDVRTGQTRSYVIMLP